MAPGGIITLTATGVLAAPGRSITQVEFYRDLNGNGKIDVGTDLAIGNGIPGVAGTYAIDYSTIGLALGTYKYLARANDNTGAFDERGVETESWLG